MHRPLVLLALAALGAVGLACEAETEAPEPERVTAEAVERYRTRVVIRMQETDGAIASLETASAQADSAGAVAYQEVLGGLRRERQAVQARLDSLHTMTPGAFEAAAADLDARLDELDEQVGNAPLGLARSAEQLRPAVLERLMVLDREVQALPPGAATPQAVAELQQERQRIEAGLAILGSPGVPFDSLRSAVAGAFDALFDRVDDLREGAAEADTSGAVTRGEATAAEGE